MEGLSAVMRESMFISILLVVASLVAVLTPSSLYGSVSRSETVIRSSASSGGNMVVQQGVVSTSTGSASARTTIIMNGETVVDEFAESHDGTPVSIDVRYPTTQATVVTTTTASSVHTTGDTVRLTPLPRVPVSRPESGFETYPRTEVPIPLVAPAPVEPITNVTSEVNEGTVKEAAPYATVTHRATPETLWTRIALSFARTITYVTSFFFK